MLRRFVRLQERRAREADQRRLRQQLRHRTMELTGLRAVAFVHENVDVALRAKADRYFRAEVAHVAVDVAFTGGAELLDTSEQTSDLSGIG